MEADSNCHHFVKQENNLDKITFVGKFILHHVSNKTVQNWFCQNFIKFPPILINVWQKDSKEAKIMWDALISHLT